MGNLLFDLDKTLFFYDLSIGELFLLVKAILNLTGIACRLKSSTLPCSCCLSGIQEVRNSHMNRISCTHSEDKILNIMITMNRN